MDGLNCRGHEASLGQCQHLPVVEQCLHSDDAGANCTIIRGLLHFIADSMVSSVSLFYIECDDSAVRLFQLDGDAENEGRVEFCSSSRWGLVCSDNWDTNDAKVVCRQLGYNVEGKLIMLLNVFENNIILHTDENTILATDKSIIGSNPDFVLLTKVDCAGTEDNLTQCPRDDTHTCLNPGAGVVCPNGK